jgi:hypothetical protein
MPASLINPSSFRAISGIADLLDWLGVVARAFEADLFARKFDSAPGVAAHVAKQVFLKINRHRRHLTSHRLAINQGKSYNTT